MILPNNFTINISDLQGINFSCESGYISENGLLFIKEGYKWDGITVAPDTDRTYKAGLIHDFLYEYRPINREIADRIFYKQLKSDGFKFAKLYYIGVKMFGSF